MSRRELAKQTLKPVIEVRRLSRHEILLGLESFGAEPGSQSGLKLF
jgi:hypothetical protein